MLKSSLVDSVLSALGQSGFKVLDCRGSRSSFDVLGRRDELLVLVKALSNVEGLSRESALELKEVASLLQGVPVVVSQRMKSSELADGTVYDRYGVLVSNPQTLLSMVNDAPPKVFSTRGNYCVHVDTEKLAQARARMGFTQDSLAERLGVSKQSVYRYERSGRVSLDVFDRMVGVFGESLSQPEFEMGENIPKEQQSQRAAPTSLKRLVRREFEDMGFNTSLINAPFDLVASREKRIFSVVSNDWRRLGYKLSILEHVSEVLDGYTVCISERKVKSDVSILSPQELGAIKSPRELFKLLSE
jgi:putative transcriptional regulator